jgi:hypothetical protein
VGKTHFYVNLVTAQHDGDVLAHTLKIAVPIGDVLVSDAGRDVKHDDATLALDVITIAESTKLFLPSSVPDIEDDCAIVGGEGQRVDFDPKGGCIIVVVRMRRSETKKNREGQEDRGKHTTEIHTDIFFLKFTSQVTLNSD